MLLFNKGKNFPKGLNNNALFPTIIITEEVF